MLKQHEDQIALISDLPPSVKGSNAAARALRLQLLAMDQKIVVPSFIQYVQTDAQLKAAADAIAACDEIAVDVETRGKRWVNGCCVALNLYAPSTQMAYFIPNRMTMAGRNFNDEEIRDTFGPTLTNPKVLKIGQNFKFDMHMMRETWKLEIAGFEFDTMVAATILNENEDHDLEYLCVKYLKVPQKWKISMSGAPFETWPIRTATKYGGLDAKYTYDLKVWQYGYLTKPHLVKLRDLVEKVEIPNIIISKDMEQRGVGFDMEYYTDVMRPTIRDNMASTSKAVYEAVGYEFNLGAPELVARALFDGLELPRIRGDHTDAAVLTELKYAGHAVAGLVLNFRQWNTINNMFVNQLPKWVYNGRIHCKFNTLGTETGRYSCSQPNLQQLPKRIGPIIRRVIIPSKGYVLVSQDYSQMELRMLAHLGRVVSLIAAFETGMDIHMVVLCDVFNIAVDYYLAHAEDTEMTALRTATKNINFGVLYGMGPEALARRIRRTMDECKEFIRQWFARYPEAKRFINKSKVTAFKQGYVETILGRKRRLPNSRSQDGALASAADRNAVNAPIQGSVADMIKLTTIKHRDIITANKWPYHVLLNMHDELLYEVPEDWVQHHKSSLDVMKDSMANILPLDVPVVVNQELLTRWGDKTQLDFDEEDLDEVI